MLEGGDRLGLSRVDAREEETGAARRREVSGGREVSREGRGRQLGLGGSRA